MGLPESIQIEPLTSAVNATVRVPGSKSLTNRALILAALADGTTILRGGLWSEDTQIMVTALKELGLSVAVEPEPEEPSNRTFRVTGLGGKIPNAGTPDRPLELFVGNAGTAARFLMALVALGEGSYRLHGVPRMHERPQGGLFDALRQLGCGVHPEGAEDRLPARIDGHGPRPGRCRVSIRESSQFASALLLCEKAAGWSVEVIEDGNTDDAYVAMTRELQKAFPAHGGELQIEPDASSGSYFWAASWLLNGFIPEQWPWKAPIQVAHWPTTGWQVDARFPERLPLPSTLSRATDLGDSILTAMVVAPFASAPVTFTDLGRLRVQECDRVEAMTNGLRRCGVDVRALSRQDDLMVLPATAEQLIGSEIETYNDHRIAMCFAVMGLKIHGIRIRNPGCVHKTFPDFFQKLAAPPPNGLGALLSDEQGKPLPSMEGDENR